MPSRCQVAPLSAGLGGTEQGPLAHESDLWEFSTPPGVPHFTRTKLQGQRKIQIVHSVAPIQRSHRNIPYSRKISRVLFSTFLFSFFFLVRKKTDFRPVLDLQTLNKNIKVQSFRMESLQSVMQAIGKRDVILRFKGCILPCPSLQRV